MSKIFWAFIFIFLDFNLNLEANTIGLVPDFVGGIFLCLAMKELKEQSSYFERNYVPSIIYTIVSVIFYFADFIGIFEDYTELEIVGWGVGLAVTALMIYVTYNVVAGIKDMQNNYQIDLQAENLYTYWLVLTILQVVGSFGVLIPMLALPIAFLVGLGVLLFVILFLIKLHTAKKNYEEYLLQRGNMNGADRWIRM